MRIAILTDITPNHGTIASFVETGDDLDSIGDTERLAKVQADVQVGDRVRLADTEAVDDDEIAALS